MADDASPEEPVADVADALRGDGASGGDVDVGSDGDHPRDGGEDATADPGSAPGGDPGSGDRPAQSGGDDQLPVRDEDVALLRRSVEAQAEDNREAVGDKTAIEVRMEVRRILGLDGKPDFESESVSHIMGLARDGERVDPELEKELRAELDALGVDLGVVKLRYETMSKEDRRQLTTFEVQQAFLRVVERVETLATRASVSLGHRIRMFDAEARDHLKLVAGVRVMLETQQKQVEALVVGFREKMQEETAGFEEVVRQEKKALSEKVKGFQTAFEGVAGHLKSCESRAHEVTERLTSAGAAAEAVEHEAARVMSELQRVASSGFAVRRLALLGGVIGSAAGGFFAFVVLLLLWAATSG